MKPLIAITTCLDNGSLIRAPHAYVYLKRTYSRAVTAAGGVPVLVSPDADPRSLAAVCDGLVISGGGILPARLSGCSAPAIEPGAEDPERILWERELVDACCAHGKPVLGICYGMQLLNLHFGGSLADVAAVGDGGAQHIKPGELLMHEIQVLSDSRYFHQLGPTAQVSSAHRQAVEQVAEGFSTAAVAPDGVVEALEQADVVAVQWHPETDATAMAIFGSLVQRAAG
jgi:putative glutamine amidotransferase